MELNERIRHAITVSDTDVRTIAKACNTSAQAVYAWMNGTVKDLRNANLFTLADITGFEARWIATGEGPEKTPGGEPRIKALVDLYQAADERGKATIYRVAEQESHYSPSGDGVDDVAA